MMVVRVLPCGSEHPSKSPALVTPDGALFSSAPTDDLGRNQDQENCDDCRLRNVFRPNVGLCSGFAARRNAKWGQLSAPCRNPKVRRLPRRGKTAVQRQQKRHERRDGAATIATRPAMPGENPSPAPALSRAEAVIESRRHGQGPQHRCYWLALTEPAQHSRPE